MRSVAEIPGQHRCSSWDIVYLRLPVLHVATVLPGDFRTVAQVKREFMENNKLGGMMLNARDSVSTYSLSGSPYGG
jgi:hypothetical protein